MKRSTLAPLLAAGFISLCSLAANADMPQVIHDSGRSVPLTPYVAQLIGDADDPTGIDARLFPIRSSLKSSVLTTEGLQVLDPTWLTQPMFVLAADDVSVRWLAYNHTKLLQLNAVGIVVQSPSAKAFKALQKMAMPLHLAPESSPWLASRLHQAGAGVYPLLVQTNGRVFQILGDQHEQ